jgi:predicted cupin superfamily sugar epimerase
MPDAEDLAARWELVPHPEGGFFRETYRSSLTTQPEGWPGPRAYATAILFLLPAGVHSARHRVRGDELWMWHAGSPMALNIQGTTHLLGPDRDAGHELHVLVPAGAWQSATPAGDEWSLVACVVSPGFDFEDFEMAGEEP